MAVKFTCTPEKPRNPAPTILGAVALVLLVGGGLLLGGGHAEPGAQASPSASAAASPSPTPATRASTVPVAVTRRP